MVWRSRISTSQIQNIHAESQSFTDIHEIPCVSKGLAICGRIVAARANVETKV